MGSSTLVLEVDFCEGILFLDRTLIPLCERGICGELPPPSDEYSVSAMLRRDLVWLSFSFLEIETGEMDDGYLYLFTVIKLLWPSSLVVVEGHSSRLNNKLIEFGQDHAQRLE